MSHTLTTDKAISKSEEEEDITIIDPEQERDILWRRTQLRLLQRGSNDKALNFSSSTVVGRKRNRGWLVIFLIFFSCNVWSITLFHH